MTLFTRTTLSAALLPFLIAAQRGPQTPLPFQIVKADPALDAVIAPDTKLETVVTIPGLNGEGPMWKDGKLWFSDQRGGNLYTVTMDGKTTVIAEKAGGPINPAMQENQGPNGLITDKDGTVLVCRQSIRDIARLNADGTFTPFLTGFEGKQFNSPNDMVFGNDGALWFTDPPFSVPGFRSLNGAAPDPKVKPLSFSGAYRYKDGKLTAMVTDLALPNGIGISPDGKTLYLNNTRPAIMRAYDIGPDGSLSNMRVVYDFAQPAGSELRGAADGMKVDSAGNVWTTGPGGILIISPKGVLLGRIQLPSGSTNLAFGDDLHSVFFTSGQTIYRLHSLVAGLKPLYFRK